MKNEPLYAVTIEWIDGTRITLCDCIEVVGINSSPCVSITLKDGTRMSVYDHAIRYYSFKLQAGSL